MSLSSDRGKPICFSHVERTVGYILCVRPFTSRRGELERGCPDRFNLGKRPPGESTPCGATHTVVAVDCDQVSLLRGDLSGRFVRTWRDERTSVHALRGEQYELIPHSSILI